MADLVWLHLVLLLPKVLNQKSIDAVFWRLHQRICTNYYIFSYCKCSCIQCLYLCIFKSCSYETLLFYHFIQKNNEFKMKRAVLNSLFIHLKLYYFTIFIKQNNELKIKLVVLNRLFIKTLVFPVHHCIWHSSFIFELLATFFKIILTFKLLIIQASYFLYANPTCCSISMVFRFHISLEYCSFCSSCYQ